MRIRNLRFLISVAALLLSVTLSWAQSQIVVSSFDSGPLWVTATPANSSHAAGTSVGGLFQIPVARGGPSPPAGTQLGFSGILTQFAWISSGGSTGQLVIRLWSKKPSNTTCTDNSAFSGSNVDNQYLVTPPFSITPAAPAVTTGDSNTYASITGITYDWLNRDVPQTNYLYACAVTVSTDTADENAAVYAMAGGPQN